MIDGVEDKLRDLRADLVRREAAASRMPVHELARRRLFDANLDALAVTWSTGFHEDVSQHRAGRLHSVSAAYACAKGAPVTILVCGDQHGMSLPIMRTALELDVVPVVR